MSKLSKKSKAQRIKIAAKKLVAELIAEYGLAPDVAQEIAADMAKGEDDFIIFTAADGSHHTIQCNPALR